MASVASVSAALYQENGDGAETTHRGHQRSMTSTVLIRRIRLLPGCESRLKSRLRYVAQAPGKSGGLNGSTQHFLGVYSQESENLKFVVGVDLSAALLCSDPTGNSRLGPCSSGSIVVRARLCFRSSRVAKDSADHRSRLSHPWPP